MQRDAFSKIKMLLLAICLPFLTASCSFIRFYGLEKLCEKGIDSFVLQAENNAALLKDVEGKVKGDRIELELPIGTELSSLVPTIKFSGKAISPASGRSLDFSSPFDYVITAVDGTTKSYRVQVEFEDEESTFNYIADFFFRAADNSGLLPRDVAGIVGGNSVQITVPYGTALTSLNPEIITLAGVTLSPLSGVAQDFTTPVEYNCSLPGEAAKSYRVVVTVGDYQPKDIVNCSFRVIDNSGKIPGDINGTISADRVDFTLPFETDLTALVPYISTSSGTTISPLSGVVRDFSSPVEYTVTSEDGTTKAYNINVTKGPYQAKDISSFSFLAADNVGLISSDENGTISGSDIQIAVPAGTDLTALTPSIVLSPGATLTPSGGVAQNFTTPVQYLVRAADGTTKSYTVTVSVKAADESLFFFFRAADNEGILPIDVPAVVEDDDNIIRAYVPYGAALNALTPTINLPTGWTSSPASGVTCNFTTPLFYTFTNEAGEKSYYQVIVMMGAEQPKQISAFVLRSINNSGKGLFNDVLGTINGSVINVTVPDHVDINGLSPFIVFDGDRLEPGNLALRDFSNGNIVSYRVTAADGTSRLFYVNLSKKSWPIASNSLLQSSSLGAGSLQLSWSAATDSTTAMNDIQYKAVYSVNPIGSLSEAEGATVAMNWTAGAFSCIVNGLSIGVEYYFALIARDSEGNRLLYTPQKEKIN